MMVFNGISRRCFSSSSSLFLSRSSAVLVNNANSPLAKKNVENFPELRYDIAACVLIERIPFLPPPLTPLQARVQRLYQELNHEWSLLSDHELRIKQDEIRNAKIQADKKAGIKVDPAVTNVRLASDDEDSWKKDLEAFSPSSFPEVNSDPTDPRRFPDRPLKLALKSKLHPTGDPTWLLPFARHREGESLRQTAERAVIEHLGSDFKVAINGNAPWAYYKNIFSQKFLKCIQEHDDPKNENNFKLRGMKVFLFKALYEGGLPVTKEPFAWCVQEELKEKLRIQEFKAVQNITWEEN